MSSNGPFGFDPEDLERAISDVGDQFREAFDFVNRFVSKDGAGLASLLEGLVVSRPRGSSRPSGGAVDEEYGAGVWVIYLVEADGSARIEQAFPNEIDALRANKNNTDPSRKVRFLPYGVTVGLLDATD